jgi:hypothetical protein
MPTLTVEYCDDAERLVLEQALAYFSQLRQAALSALTGRVLDTCEQLALSDGRALLRSTLASALQGHIDAEEQQKGAGAAMPRAVAPWPACCRRPRRPPSSPSSTTRCRLPCRHLLDQLLDLVALVALEGAESRATGNGPLFGSPFAPGRVRAIGGGGRPPWRRRAGSRPGLAATGGTCRDFWNRRFASE